jgi:hypothetical protein
MLYKSCDSNNMSEKVSTPQVRPGQVWADNDKRAAGRTLRVDRIENGKAVCTVLTNSDYYQREVEAGRSAWVVDKVGKTTRISLQRFKPTNTGYRLVEDVA